MGNMLIGMKSQEPSGLGSLGEQKPCWELKHDKSVYLPYLQVGFVAFSAKKWLKNPTCWGRSKNMY